eukprot:TRINITY_DN5921_c0_g1_i4.p2 TRINITY_DN5921_c0_g1~~TRINITY_DN5921_c0_g1_i4.p2  ORF type:complete len:288 (+),score=78.07 TRINITY_DN5921_c0_g1_i4:48-911(+)
MGLTGGKIEIVESKFEGGKKEEEELGTYHYYTFDFESSPRCFLVFVPHSLGGVVPKEGGAGEVPLVMLIPGTDECIVDTELRVQTDLDVDTNTRHGAYYSWQKEAQEKQFMLVFVQGVKDTSTPKVRYCFDLGDRDLNYIDEVIKFTLSKYPIINPNKLYALGFSVGGLFISSLAIYRPRHFAALCNYMGGLVYIPSYMKSDPALLQDLESKIPKIEHATRKVPLFLVTAAREDNRNYCMHAKKVFEGAGWELKFRDIAGESHRYIWTETAGIWEWFRGFTLGDEVK